jgi:hypothetical protein
MLNSMTRNGANPIRRMKNIGGFVVTNTGQTIATPKDGVYAPISEHFLDVLLGEDKSQVDTTPGSVIQLVGQVALPCVCEVPPSSAPLFSPAGAKVVSQGITWQSLYLVLIGHNFVLVEPDRQAIGDGRVVTRCPLERVSADKDPADARADTAARRLMVSHRSHMTTTPGLFVFDKPPIPQREGCLIRSKQWKSKLDVWFEDNNAVKLAFNKVQESIIEAKINRGRRIQIYLAQNEGSSYPRNVFLYK